ncbi:expressed unknown protein [Seminavis robusta]|uniref:WRKY19-like zinc finger domain-containing protein n=1 Tax=Seminavis robusta TaxID=568900 RepID=A0A9N8DQM7_9STRA|nr:expressed unknown protein [Seminavis robusta]|eukprot:Sro188_g081180.1 n/a (757) ;mRNA; f:40635-42905
MPSDARDVADDRIREDPTATSSTTTFEYESTADGDVVIHHHHHHAPTPTDSAESNKEKLGTWQSPGIRASANKRHNRHHSRNLSAHFFDATKLTDDDDEVTFDKKESSPAVGQKHRRMFSGDVSNPPLAHRRINSIGNAAAVDRFLGRPRNRHRREDSAGLDILSAAVDVTNDELADAAGARTTPIWEDGSHNAPANTSATAKHQRLSSLDFYDYSAIPPPTNTRHPHPATAPPAPVVTAGPMKPPPARSFPHPHTTPHPHHHGYMPPPPGHPHHPPPPPPTLSYHHHHPHHPPPPPPPHHHHHHHPHYPPPPSYYSHAPPPPPGHVHPPPPPPPPRSYPVQYSHRAPPPEPYKTLYPPPVVEEPRQSSPTAGTYGDEKIESDEKLFGNKDKPTEATTANATPWTPETNERDSNTTAAAAEPPAPTSTSTTTAAPEPSSKPSSMSAHHRKLSSFSSMGALISASMFAPPEGDEPHPLKAHHRATSSTISFLQGLDVLEGSDLTFLHNVQASAPSYGAPAPAPYAPPPAPRSAYPVQPPHYPPPPVSSAMPPPPPPPLGPPPPTTSQPPLMGTVDEMDEPSKLAAGGASKRVRRKCTMAGCPNRVVQGGLCISHGAKRKTCKHAGCTKNVKKAGLCSTHGPARKRCEAEGCGKVAVQGGRCIAHGAKKKLCSVENCKKQAILSGMCKKHHDKFGGDPNDNTMTCVVIGSNNSGTEHATTTSSRPAQKPGHHRGLSIFQDLSVDAVGNLLADDDPLSL